MLWPLGRCDGWMVSHSAATGSSWQHSFSSATCVLPSLNLRPGNEGQFIYNLMPFRRCPAIHFLSSDAFALQMRSRYLFCLLPKEAPPCGRSPSAIACPQFSFIQASNASSSSSVRWKARQGKDVFAREAKVAGLKSRAAFKLLQVLGSSLYSINQQIIDP